MRTFHHVGIPTRETRENESYMEGGKLYITEVDASPNKIEWLRFEDDSPMPELLQTTAHIAYKIDDLDAELKGKEILLQPFEAAPGVTVAFIVEEGAPIELMHVAK